MLDWGFVDASPVGILCCNLAKDLRIRIQPPPPTPSHRHGAEGSVRYVRVNIDNPHLPSFRIDFDIAMIIGATGNGACRVLDSSGCVPFLKHMYCEQPMIPEYVKFHSCPVEALNLLYDTTLLSMHETQSEISVKPTNEYPSGPFGFSNTELYLKCHPGVSHKNVGNGGEEAAAVEVFGLKTHPRHSTMSSAPPAVTIATRMIPDPHAACCIVGECRGPFEIDCKNDTFAITCPQVPTFNLSFELHFF